MVHDTNNEVHPSHVGHTVGLIAMFLAGAGVVATVVVLASRANSEKMARSSDNVLHACDRAMQKLERRISMAS